MNTLSRRIFLRSSALTGVALSLHGPLLARAEAPAVIRLGLASYTFREFSRAQTIGYMKQLRQAADTAGKQKVMLVIENEFACNTATGREAAATLVGVPSRNFALNWDPGNAVMRGELDAFPGGWAALPKDRIHHCHVKNAVKDAAGKVEWSPVDIGLIDWAAQFKALRDVGYSDAVNLETHWKGTGTMEEASRISWAGMKKELAQANG